MKALVQNGLGDPADALALMNIEDRQPAPGEVLIEVRLAPVHHGDIQMVRAQPEIPEDVGYIRRGSEAVGVIRALGSNVDGRGNLKVGDRVVGFPAMRSWAESVAVPASAAVPVPPDLSDEAAAQLFSNYMTARMVLRGLRNPYPTRCFATARCSLPEPARS